MVIKTQARNLFDSIFKTVIVNMLIDLDRCIRPGMTQ